MSEDIGLRELQKQAHATAVEKGWWDNKDRNIGEQLMLMVTELAEAMESHRSGRNVSETFFVAFESGLEYHGQQLHPKDKPDGFPIEIADLLIRVADTAERYGIDLAEAVRLKMKYNQTRQHRHGGKTC